MPGFFEELERRKVYRVAIAYVVGSWALAQGLAQVLPVFDVSNAAIRVLIALLLLGFPVALVFAWIFDITPSGIRRTSAIVPQDMPKSERRRSVFLLGGVGLAIAAVGGFFLLPRAIAHKVDKSIAVLPFENLSDDKENAYFADGVQDDILTNLSKINDLKVISRTSVMGYRGKAENVREIGKLLGVSNILEGSVRRSGNKVRVNVQLIDTSNDQHLWAQDYDGDLTDVFKIQSDLAMKIAAALQARLSPAEKEHMEHKPTENNEAFVAYERAHALQSGSYEDFGKLKEGEEMYEKAIQLDPNFALALARYSQLESWIVHTFSPTPERREKARALAVRAAQLQPDLPEAHLALGFVYYYVDKNFDAAAREFEIAQLGLPNDSEVYLSLGAIQRRQGKWSESNASLEKAVALNPRDTWAMQNLAINYEMQRDFGAANRMLDRALAVNPAAISLKELKAKVAVEERGDFSLAHELMASLDRVQITPENRLQLAFEHVQASLLLRQFDDAVREAEKLPDDAIAAFPGALCGKYVNIGAAKKWNGDEKGAREVFEKAKALAEEDIKQTPNDGSAHARLAETLAWLGQKDAAMREISKARELLPETKDAFDGPAITQAEAQIHAMFGDAVGAVSILGGLLQRPSAVSVAVLKLDPIWDSIRKDPAFQKLIRDHEQKA